MEWIETGHRLPEDKQIVLTCDIYNTFVTMAKFIEEDNVFELMYMQEFEQDSYPSHWMPLPNLPDEE